MTDATAARWKSIYKTIKYHGKWILKRQKVRNSVLRKEEIEFFYLLASSKLEIDGVTYKFLKEHITEIWYE